MIEIPKIAKPDSGMVFRKPSWHAVYYVDGDTRTRSLGTGDKPAARVGRDAFFASLVSSGALERAVRNRIGPKTYIYEEVRYKVQVPGHKVLFAKSPAEALEMRDKILNDQP